MCCQEYLRLYCQRKTLSSSTLDVDFHGFKPMSFMLPSSSLCMQPSHLTFGFGNGRLLPTRRFGDDIPRPFKKFPSD